MNSEKKRIALQVVLFIITFFTTTLAGSWWSYGRAIFFSENFTWDDFALGLPYSIAFLFILSAHEFGHYFTARYHAIKTSLPYYIPLPPVPSWIGTLGALIRIRQRIPTTTQNFDVGIAGPLAGFVAALMVLIYGMLTLPPPEHIFTIHPEYQQYGLQYADHVYTNQFLASMGGDFQIGYNLMMDILASLFADPQRMPNPHELMHYPLLFAGYLSLVFTALNLLPVGQLDGGHVVYGMFGERGHTRIAQVAFIAFVFYAGLGLVHPDLPNDDLLLRMPLYGGFLFFTFQGLKLDVKSTLIVTLAVFLTQYLCTMFFPGIKGYEGFLLFAFLLGRFVGITHPGAASDEPLTPGRKILGWIALAILVLCFTPRPLNMILVEPEQNPAGVEVSVVAPPNQIEP